MQRFRAGRVVRAVAKAIDDPTRDVNAPLFTPKGDYTVTTTLGYLLRLSNRPVQLQLVINNLLNDRTIYWTASTNGAATTALRPRDGDYRSPARETVPVGFGQKTPINFNRSASWRRSGPTLGTESSGLCVTLL